MACRVMRVFSIKEYKILKTNDMEWIFDGIGTALISGFIGLFVGGYAGYKVGIKKADVKQKQKAKNNSTQIQIGINDGSK
jgi:hypothetical protein